MVEAEHPSVMAMDWIELPAAAPREIFSRSDMARANCERFLWGGKIPTVRDKIPTIEL